jgi:L-glyceraldehyde 3-phosphate reductase
MSTAEPPPEPTTSEPTRAASTSKDPTPTEPGRPPPPVVGYRRTGRSGLLLPTISLGLWQNFGEDRPLATMRDILTRAFELGITHFDLANNYGPPPGSAERHFGEILRTDFAGLRNRLVVSTKAGYLMWGGPYGEWGSRKYLLSSLDESLERMGLDYVDIFYSHRFDPNTPLEETMGALASAVQQGKALYAGVSSYSSTATREAARLLRKMGAPCLIHQPSYSMLNRWIEGSLLNVLEDEGIGCIAFSPLAQGLLTSKYLDVAPTDIEGTLPGGARAAKDGSFRRGFLTEETLEKVHALARIARLRGQTLAQMALAWCLRDPRVTSVLIGASSVRQLEENVAALENLAFTQDELDEIDRFATDAGINIWRASSEAGGEPHEDRAYASERDDR